MVFIFSLNSSRESAMFSSRGDYVLKRLQVPGFHVPLQKYAGLGACCRPGGVSVTSAQKLRTLPTSSTFWFKRLHPLRLSYITIFRRRFRYLHHTSYLALTRFWGYQEGPPLAIKPPHRDTVLRYIVRAALDSCP